MTKIPGIGIDVGYSDTKAAFRDASGEVTFTSFPSLFTEKDSPNEVYFTNAREYRQIEIAGKWYAVGPGVELLPRALRITTSDYSSSDPYLALTLGMMADICATQGARSIETLVVGLPVTSAAIKERRTALISKLQGTHKLPAKGIVGAWEMHVERVVVLPQPAGTFVRYLSSQPVSKVLEPALIIDVGNGTSDWVFTNDDDLVLERSGSIPQAMMHVKKTLAQAMAQQGYVNITAEDIDRIIRKGHHFVENKRIALKDLDAPMQPLLAELAMSVTQAIGQNDAPQVIVTGGAAGALAPHFAKIYSGSTVAAMTPQSALENVHGFLLYSEYK